MMCIRALTAIFLLSLHEKVAFAFPGGAGSCVAGPAVGGFHLSRPQTTGSLSEGEFEVLLNGAPLTVSEVANFPLGEIANLTLRATGETEFLGYLLRLNLFDDDTMALTPDSTGQVSGLCDAQLVSSSTHTNADPKAAVTSMLDTDVLTELTLDVTVVVRNIPESSVWYHSTYTIRQANTQGCSICGDGREVTAPDEIFAFPGQPTVPCGELESAGENGMIPVERCQFLEPLLDVCECREVNAKGCSVCGDGLQVTAPDEVFAFPGQPAVPCGDLEIAGENGQIPLAQCPFLPPLLTVCECAPITAAPVSPAPVVMPPTTSMPVMIDTPAPASACGSRNDACTLPSDCCSNACQRRPGSLEGECLSSKSANKAGQKLGGARGGAGGGNQAKR